MDHQRHIGHPLDRADAPLIQPARMIGLQMHIAHGNRHRIDPGFTGKACGLLRVRPGRGIAPRIAHETDLALAGDTGRMGQFRHLRRLCNILRQRLARSVIHERGKARIQRFAAFVKRVTMVQMHHDRHIHAIRQMPHHRAQNRQGRMRAARWPRLQDHGRALGLRGHRIGAHILPPKTDKTGHGIAIAQGRAQHIREGGKCHLNFATISMMPGIVCNCSAWVGWKYCFRLRCDCPPRMVK